MKRNLVSLFLLLAITVAANLHLPVMQIAAWTGMLLDYSRDTTFSVAVVMTFDGEHPCPMCLAIEAEQTRTDPDAIQGESLGRLVMFIEPPFAWRAASSPIETLFPLSSTGRHLSRQPETPPPRTALA